MSRSLRKHNIITEQQGSSTKITKRKASRAVRAKDLEHTPKNGKAYRKEFNSWNICDYKFVSTDPKFKRK